VGSIYPKSVVADFNNKPNKEVQRIEREAMIPQEEQEQRRQVLNTRHLQHKVRTVETKGAERKVKLIRRQMEGVGECLKRFIPEKHTKIVIPERYIKD